MTFNLRTRVDFDGINIFDNRLPRVVKVIKDELPDLIGFQEATTLMKRMIEKEISDTYVIVGCGREKTYRGESVCIAYRRELFELVSFDTFWLSDTPDVSGSRYAESDQSPFPRLTVCATLSPEGYDGVINMYNTHLDHKGLQARNMGVEQIMEKIRANGGTFILTGDMNARPDSECIAKLGELDGVVEATAELTHTFHNYGKISEGYKIDYIYTNAKANGAYTVEDIPVEGVYVSDHYPVCAELEI